MSASRRHMVHALSRAVVLIVVLSAAALVALHGIRSARSLRSFGNPIAFAIRDSLLYVVERQGNTVLQLKLTPPGQPLEQLDSFQIEEDDDRHYYVVRKLYRGHRGVVVQSYIYDRKSQKHTGYRFREYTDFNEPPAEILTIILPEDTEKQEVFYAADSNGNHYFANEHVNQLCIWRLPSGCSAVIEGPQVPPEIEALGSLNSPLSNWLSIQVNAEGMIYLASGETGRIHEYSPSGAFVREIGAVGFGEGELLAPDALAFVAWPTGTLERLVVPSAGNRTWVRYDAGGRADQVWAPLRSGYAFADILVSAVSAAPGIGLCAFDLANKCLVYLDAGFATATLYRHRLTLGIAGWLALALVLVLLGFYYRRVRSVLLRLTFPFFFKLLFLFIPILIGSAWFMGEWMKDDLEEDLLNEYVSRMASLAEVVAGSLSVPDLERIQKPEDRLSPVYEQVYQSIHRLVDSLNSAHTSWILHKIHEGNYYFGVNNWRGPIFEPFVVSSDRPMFMDALRKKEPLYGQYHDDQGNWFSYLYPIQNARGEVVYVLELYRPTEELTRIEDEITEKVTGIAGGTVLMAILLAMLFSYWFTRPIRILAQATRLISRGNFDHPVRVHTHDEFRAVAADFNKMLVDLKKYIADLARTTAEKQRIESELTLARQVQQELLPDVFPPLPGAEQIEVCARMDPAREVGGDYYDFFFVDGDHLGVAIADVSGKGVAAGLFMMRVRTLLRDTAHDNLSPADVVTRINRLIVPDNPSTMFVTLIYMIVEMKTGLLRLCSAGHEPPVLLAPGAVPVEIDAGRGMAAGISEDAAYQDAEIILNPGFTILLYTDGLTDAIDEREELYGKARLLKCMERNAALPNKEISTRIFEEITRYQAGLDQFDDMTLLCLKRLE